MEGRRSRWLAHFVLKQLLYACSHKETERALGKEAKRGEREREGGAEGRDKVAAAHEEKAEEERFWTAIGTFT